MKRIYCDSCGDEMDHKDMGVLSGTKTGATLRGVRHVAVTIEFDFKNGSGEHVDVCQKCRWDIIRKFMPNVGGM